MAGQPNPRPSGTPATPGAPPVQPAKPPFPQGGSAPIRQGSRALQPATQPHPDLSAPVFPTDAQVPAFIPGHPNTGGPLLKDPIMGAAPYNGRTGPASS